MFEKKKIYLGFSLLKKSSLNKLSIQNRRLSSLEFSVSGVLLSIRKGFLLWFYSILNEQNLGALRIRQTNPEDKAFLFCCFDNPKIRLSNFLFCFVFNEKCAVYVWKGALHGADFPEFTSVK